MLPAAATRPSRPGSWVVRRGAGFRQWMGLAVAGLLAFSMWFYVDRVLVSYQKADAARAGRPRGNLSDLYPRWVGARDLLLYGQDPYSRATTLKAQQGYYGRALDPARPADPRDQQGFAYPVYVVFLIAPTIRMDFSAVQEAFRWTLLGLTVVTAPLWLAALRWRLSGRALLTLLLLTAGSFPAAQGIKLQQLSLLVSPLIAGAAAALAAGVPAIAGVLLAIATIKPQITVPLAACLGLWSLGDLRRRWVFPAVFLLSVAVLVGAGEAVLPGWIAEFWRALGDYRRYTGGVSLPEALLGRTAGLITTTLLLAFLGLLSWRVRGAEPRSREFQLLVALSLAVTVVVIPTWAPYNHLLLLPGAMLLVRDWRLVVRGRSPARLMYLATGAVVAWPWVASLGLTLASLALTPEALQKRWPLPLYTSIPTPLAVTAMLVVRALGPGGENRRFRLKSGSIPK